MLAQKLGINCYSREILKMASEDSGINERLFGMSDEKIRHAGWLKTLSHPYTGELLPPEDKGFTSDDNLFNYQAKTIKELAEKESCIIVGRCADAILEDCDHLIRIFIYAPYEDRIVNCVNDLGMDTKAAKRMIRDVDKARDAYHMRYAGYLPNDMNHMDLMVNSATLGVDMTARLLAEVVRDKFS